MAKLVINENKTEGHINPEIYGHFSEHLGRCIYEGLYVKEDSGIPNVNGMRTDVVEALKEMLQAATEALRPGGRLVVITYHSLEDRMVKNIMKTGNVEGKAESDFFGNLQTPFRLVNNKVIVPDEAEIERNPRSRSAKLRIAEKK